MFQAMVRLHQPATSLQIGEILYAHFISVDEMVFEMAQVPGKFLKIKGGGAVEFSFERDVEAIFKVGNSPSKALYLMPKMYLHQYNSRGSRGWYFTMTRQGQLVGNGEKGCLAEWQLVSAAVQINGTDNQPPPVPQSSILQEYSNPLIGGGVVAEDTFSVGGQSCRSQGSTHSNSSAHYFRLPSCDSGYSSCSQTQAHQHEALRKQHNARILRGDHLSHSAAVPQLGFPPNSPGSQASQQSSSLAAVGLSMESPAFPGYAAGKDALMKYFYTDEGFLFLQSSTNAEALQFFLRDGLLSNKSAQFPVFQQFFQRGFTIIRQVVSSPLLQAANKILQFWMYRYSQQAPSSLTSPSHSVKHFQQSHTATANGLLKSRHGAMYCVGDICQDVDLLALYFESGLSQLTQYLLGKDDVAHPKTAQIRMTFPSLDCTVESPALHGDQWIVEGFNGQGDHSPFSLLLAVALTDITEADMGNICVHPESHMLLLDMFKDHVLYRRTQFSEDPSVQPRPNLGLPQQVCLKAGDTFVCTQRLATLFSINSSFSTTTMVFFRVSHIDHAQLKHAALDSPWVEFPLASYYLDASGPPASRESSTGETSTSAAHVAAAAAAPVAASEVLATAVTAAPLSAVAAPIDTYSGGPIVAQAVADDPFASLFPSPAARQAAIASRDPFAAAHGGFPADWSVNNAAAQAAPATEHPSATSLDLLWTDVTPTTPFSPPSMPSSASTSHRPPPATQVPSTPPTASAAPSTSSSAATSQRINPVNHTIAFSPSSQSSSSLLFVPSQPQANQAAATAAAAAAAVPPPTERSPPPPPPKPQRPAFTFSPSSTSGFTPTATSSFAPPTATSSRSLLTDSLSAANKRSGSAAPPR
eukprot:gene6378-4583_t